MDAQTIVKGKKLCSRCKNLFPATSEFFHSNKSKRNKSGFTSQCKKCRREYDKERYLQPEIKARIRELSQRPETKARAKEYGKKYYQQPENKERRKEWTKEYYQRPEVKESRKEY